MKFFKGRKKQITFKNKKKIDATHG